MFVISLQNTVFLLFFFSKAELGFRAGDIIYVLGDMDQDGFYYVSVYALYLTFFYVEITLQF